MGDAVIRPATPADAQGVADVYLASRKTFLVFAPLAHSDDEVRAWVTSVLIPSGGVTVAVQKDVEELVGMMALSHDGRSGWIDHIYLTPPAVGQGLGARFMSLAKERLGSPIRLYTFQDNVGARRFYERHGFRVLELGDGSANEERCPDMLYEWAT